MSSQTATIIDLSSYRARRNAARTATPSSLDLQPLQFFPFYAPAFVVGFWPIWVMAPAPNGATGQLGDNGA